MCKCISDVLHLCGKVNWALTATVNPSFTHPCIHLFTCPFTHTSTHPYPPTPALLSRHLSTHPLGSRTTSPDQPSLSHKVICWESAHQAQFLLMWFLQNRQISTAVANIMAAMAKALPSYAWLTALPQLISRICHTNPEVNTVTNHIITHVAEAYPQQVLIPETLVSHRACW